MSSINIIDWFIALQLRWVDSIGYDKVIRLTDFILFIAGFLTAIIIMIFWISSKNYKTKTFTSKEFDQFCFLVLKNDDEQPILYGNGTPKNFLESLEFIVTILFFPHNMVKRYYTLKNKRRSRIIIIILSILAIISLIFALLATITVIKV